MRRIRELIDDAKKRYPSDDFFSNFDRKLKCHPLVAKSFRAYNDALMMLDDESWQILKAKALQHYLNHRRGQWKQGFFNQLNESFAYRYLVRHGFDDVRFIKEGKKTTPDIRFRVHNTFAYCEVKTVGISNDEIDRRGRINVAYDGSVYARLSDGFLKKFCDAITVGRQQIYAVGTKGMVYIIINFDDFAGLCYDIYRKQLIALLGIHEFDNVYIQIGLQGNRRICKVNTI